MDKLLKDGVEVIEYKILPDLSILSNTGERNFVMMQELISYYERR